MVLWCLSVHPGLRPSFTVFRTFLLHALSYWAELWYVLSSYEHLIKIECRQFQFPSIFVGVMPLLELEILEIQGFFALFSYMLWHIELIFCICLCYTVLQIKFECLQFASMSEELWPFWISEYWKCTVFRTFLLQALTYWAEIFHMTLLHCTDQVRVSSLCVKFYRSYAPFVT